MRRALFSPISRMFARAFAKYSALPVLLTLSGCMPGAGQGPFKITPSADIQPAFDVPSVLERMIYLARQEWILFGRPEVDDSVDPPVLIYPPATETGQETQPPLLSRVILYWYSVSPQPLAGYDGAMRPWSAAFISWLAQSAGVPARDLPPSLLHWDYIEHALEAGSDARFIARDAKIYAPKPGDLLCAPRGDDFVNEVTGFDRLRRGAFHCDLAVGQRPGRLDVIGGNVLDAVSLTHVDLDDRGRVLPNPFRPWRVVLEQRLVD